jgi:hypothetical protein
MPLLISRPGLAVLLALPALSGCSRERLDISRFVSIYPGSPVVEMPGDEAHMKVVVRNVSENKLTDLRLEINSEALRSSHVSPTRIEALIPGDRTSFSARLRRKPGKAAQRYPLLLTLYGQGLPAPAGLDLMIDLSPPPEKGWIDVGQVQLVGGSQRRTALYLLAVVPLLLLAGWLLWRFSRRRAAGNETSPPER